MLKALFWHPYEVGRGHLTFHPNTSPILHELNQAWLPHYPLLGSLSFVSLFLFKLQKWWIYAGKYICPKFFPKKILAKHLKCTPSVEIKWVYHVELRLVFFRVLGAYIYIGCRGRNERVKLHHPKTLNMKVVHFYIGAKTHDSCERVDN